MFYDSNLVLVIFLSGYVAVLCSRGNSQKNCQFKDRIQTVFIVFKICIYQKQGFSSDKYIKKEKNSKLFSGIALYISTTSFPFFRLDEWHVNGSVADANGH